MKKIKAWLAAHSRPVAIGLLVLPLLELAVLVGLFFNSFPEAGAARDSFNYAALLGMVYVLVMGGIGTAVHRLLGIYRPRPMKVDPNLPPAPGVFAREPEDTPVLCYCHGNPICDGQAVISWPQPPLYTCDTTTEASK